MDVDPRTNVVVFQLNIPEVPHPVGQAPTQADDGIQQAWEAAVRDDRATPQNVTALHTEWEPTPTDTSYIKATFPKAEVAYNFTRPPDEGWEEALAAAGKALQETAAREAEPQDSDGLEPESETANSEAGEVTPLTSDELEPEAGTADSDTAAAEPRGGDGLGHVVADSDAGEAGPPAAGGLGRADGTAKTAVAETEPDVAREAGPEVGAANAEAGEAEPPGGDEPETEARPANSDAAVAESRDGDGLEPAAEAVGSDAGDVKPSAAGGSERVARAAGLEDGEAESRVGDSGLGVAGLAGGAAPVVSGELVPMLWSESSPLGLGLEDVPHWPVVVGRLHLGLAVVIHTRRGTDSVYPVTYEQVGGHSFDVVMAEACDVLASRLAVGVRETEGGRLFSLSGTLVAAAVCLPAFYRRLSGRIETDRLVVGVSSQDEVFVAAAGGPLAGVVEQLVHESPHPDTEVVPTLLQVTAAGVRFVSERARMQP